MNLPVIINFIIIMIIITLIVVLIAVFTQRIKELKEENEDDISKY